MKRVLLTLAVCLLVVAMLLACGKKSASVVQPEPLTETNAGTEQATGLPSPMHDMDSYAALLKAQPQNMLSDAPEGQPT